jgi:hypothetical protein
MIKDNWRECRERYTAFWGNRRVDRPPVFFDSVGPYGHPMYRGVGYDYTRYGEDVAALRAAYLSVWEARAACRDDAVPCISPQLGGVIEAAFWAGEIEWGTEVANLSPHHPFAEIEDLGSIRFDPANRYYARLMRELVFLSDAAAGAYGVNAEASLSITTTISQLIGAERYLLAAYDEPEGVRALAERVTDQLVSLLAEVRKCTPHPDGGTCHRWLNYWNPGWGFWFSEDDSILLSPGIYNDLYRDLDARLCASSPCTSLHWHSGGMHLTEAFAGLPGLRMVQISFDPSGGGFGPAAVDAMVDRLASFVGRGGKVCFQMGYDADIVRQVFRRMDPSSCMFYFGAARDLAGADATVLEIERLARAARGKASGA